MMETNYAHAIESLIQRAEIPIQCTFRKSEISVNDFATLQPGDIIRLDKNVEDELDVYVGNIQNLLLCLVHPAINMQLGLLL